MHSSLPVLLATALLALPSTVLAQESSPILLSDVEKSVSERPGGGTAKRVIGTILIVVGGVNIATSPLPQTRFYEDTIALGYGLSRDEAASVCDVLSIIGVVQGGIQLGIGIPLLVSGRRDARRREEWDRAHSVSLAYVRLGTGDDTVPGIEIAGRF
jgi:hypothetical protein